jgi:peptidoglycan/LPS O-acetylase OafA/YrhL
MSAVPSSTPPTRHLSVLDGWRGLSLLLVMFGHWFPFGPAHWGLNQAVATTGMVMFFALSGFLITSFLYTRPTPVEFLLRRLLRIVPLAWLYMAVVLVLTGANAQQWAAHLLFYVNEPPQPFNEATAHLWSLCVELHFYIGVALVVGLFGRRALWCLPPLCVAVTAHRVANGQVDGIQTQFRVDEILSGATVALLHQRWGLAMRRPRWATAGIVLLVLLLLTCGHVFSETLQYARPYVAGLLLALVLTLAGSDQASAVGRLLKSRLLGYIAKISYALYVLHVGLQNTWLGSGDGWAEYVKRPLLIAATWALAHFSTVTFEARAIALGRSLARRYTQRNAA